MGYSLSLVTLILPSSCRKDTEPGSHTENWDKPLNPIPAPQTAAHISVALRWKQILFLLLFGPQNHLGFPLCKRIQGDMVTAQGGMHRWFSEKNRLDKLHIHDPEVSGRGVGGIPCGIVHYSPSHSPHSQPKKSLYSP